MLSESSDALRRGRLALADLTLRQLVQVLDLLGIAAAAQALELDFVPLFKERYDLVIPKQFAEDELLSPLFGLLTDSAFRKAVSQLIGYDVSVMGTIILED